MEWGTIPFAYRFFVNRLENKDKPKAPASRLIFLEQRYRYKIRNTTSAKIIADLRKELFDSLLNEDERKKFITAWIEFQLAPFLRKTFRQHRLWGSSVAICPCACVLECILCGLGYFFFIFCVFLFCETTASLAKIKLVLALPYHI